MALNTRQPIEELREILEAMNFFEKVSTERVTPLTEESILPSIYINYDSDINEKNGKMANNGSEYDRMLYITLNIHLDLTNEDNLFYLDVRDMVEEAILKDNQLWQVVIDRDVVGSKWDDNSNFPRKQGEMGIILFTRGCIK